MAKKTRKYSAEFKEEAIRLALKSPAIAHTAKELGIPARTLQTWVEVASKKMEASSTEGDTKNVETLIAENRRLQKELEIAKEEKEILKKAAAYFAQHQK